VARWCLVTSRSGGVVRSRRDGETQVVWSVASEEEE
jgi:hypothetical protein